MRTLKFIVNGQTITLDPECDVSDLVPGTNGYVQAHFTFSPEWNKCVKVAAFYSNLGREYEPQALKAGEVCEIPSEALKKSIFKVKVFGKKNDYTICTNKVTVYQRGG
jgi:hypothetical protein